MSYKQKIQCNVAHCTHNCIDDCTCRLDKILVSPCTVKANESAEDTTACASYRFCGDLNITEIVGRD